MKTWTQFLQMVKESSYDSQGFWAGEGGGASGVLPIALDSGLICLGWRSHQVHMGNCWGTLGGAIQVGMSPAENAREELAEETGYEGQIQLIPAYVFTKGTFRYHNFLGLVPSEFPFSPKAGHSWETDRIEWFPHDELLKQMTARPAKFHAGLIGLFQHSSRLIEDAANKTK